jgi:predicted GNAT family acetyltransferase
MSDVRDNPAEHRYEIQVDGQLAGFVRYRRTIDGVIDLLHTEVDPRFEGKGVGSALARGTLDDIRAKGGRMIATCPFITAYLERHPGYRDLLAHG